MKLAPFLVVALLFGVTLTVLAEAPWAIKGSTSATAGPRNFVRSYSVLSTTDAATVVGTQSWRVINGTGNCCENHITVTSTGRIIDMGANWPTFSDNGGLTWQRFSGTSGALVGAEGSGSNAPNGDWVGMTWDPYTGDRVIAYKYVAAENAWYSSMVALHGPFYDRPWVGVVPGPITFQGTTYPYMTLMRGGAGAPVVKTTYVSFDGLTYALLSPGDLSTLNRETAWLDQPSGVAWADWVQPIAAARVMPLAGGGALASTERLCGWAHVETDADMRCFSLPNGVAFGPGSAPRVDSLGRIHFFENARISNVSYIVHNMSTDGGRNWTSINLRLPNFASYQTNMLDSAVNGALDMAVVGVRADVFLPTGQTTKILIYKITNLSTASPDVEILQVGKGDRLFGSGVNSPYQRFDFMTLGLLPDGRVVTSFGDWVHSTPRIAVEMP